jgi:hypothetical protein
VPSSLGDLLDLQSTALTFTANFTGAAANISGCALDAQMLVSRMQVRVASQSLLNQNESGFMGKMRQAYFGNDRQDSVLIGDFQSSDEYTSVTVGTAGAPGYACRYSNQAIYARASDDAYNIIGFTQTYTLPLSYLQAFFNNATLLPLGLLQMVEIDLYLAPSAAICVTAIPNSIATFATADAGNVPIGAGILTQGQLVIGSMQLRYDVVTGSELLQQSLQLLASSDSPLQIPCYVNESASVSLPAAGNQTVQVSRSCYSLEKMYLGRTFSNHDGADTMVKGIFYNGALQNYQIQSSDGKFYPLTPYRDFYEAIGAGSYNGIGGYYSNERRANITRKQLLDIESIGFAPAPGNPLSMSTKAVIVTDFGKLRAEDTREVSFNGLSTATTGSVLNIRYTDATVGGNFITNQCRIQLEFLRVIHVQNRTVSIPV